MDSISLCVLSPCYFDPNSTVLELITHSGGWNKEAINSSFNEDEASVILNILIGGLQLDNQFLWHYKYFWFYTL